MDFFINKNATLPILKLELIQDGRNDYKRFHELIQNADIYFTMSDVETGIKKIGKKPALCMYKEPINDCCDDEYYLAYQFTEKETKIAGTYSGKFIIEFLDGSGTLIVPIREELFIHVLDGSIKK
jgi:hypothetical protein